MHRTDLSGLRETIREHGAWTALLVALVLPLYAGLLIGDEGVLSRDYGMLFADFIEQQRRAWLDGSLLFWDRAQLGGTTAWGLPNEAPFYPPLVLLVLLRGTIAGLNTTVVLHVLWGGLGAYALTYALSQRKLAALVAGAIFGWAWFTRHLAHILPLELVASAWIPWTLFFLVKALESERWLRPTILAALAYASVLWIGGFIQFLPGLLVVGCVIGLGSLRAPVKTNLRRGGSILFVFVALMSLLSLGKLLPMLRWSELTDRAGGITREFALGSSLTPAQIVHYALNEGWLPWTLAAIGVLLGLRKRFDWVVPIAAAVVLLVLASNEVLYGFLYDYVPGFDHVREPRRVWMLMAAVLPVAAALGVSKLQSALAKTLRGRQTLRIAAVILLFAALAVDRGLYSRYPLPTLTSLSERMAANEIHQDLARRAQTEPRFRVVDLRKARPRIKDSAEQLHSAFDLEGLEGILGNVSLELYDNEYLKSVRGSPARVLGLLNARYVTSSVPLEEHGLEFVARFEPDPLRFAPGIDGPFLYRNTLALPRAALLDHALLQVGGSREQHMAMLCSDIWRPESMLLVTIPAEELAEIPRDLLRRFDLAMLAPEQADDPDLEDTLAAAELPGYVLTDLPTGGSPELRRATDKIVAPLQALPDPPREWNRMRVNLPAEAGGRWLMLAETFASYPGWSAEIDGAPARLWNANGIATAIQIPEGAREVDLRYVPPGFALGMSGSAAGLLLCGVLLLRRRPVFGFGSGPRLP